MEQLVARSLNSYTVYSLAKEENYIYYMEKLPLEIALEIFYRLPPESVVRCKFVCKSWCSLVPNGDDSNNFANMHLLRHRQYLQYNDSTLNFIDLHKFGSDKNVDLLEERKNSSTIVGGEFRITEYNADEENKLNNYNVKTIKFPHHFGIRWWIWNSRYPKLAGSCNGLLCLPIISDQSSNLSIRDRIWICNPLLNEYVPLPVSDLQLRCRDTTASNMAVGFGHLPSTDEYKVVRVYYSDSNSYIGEVEVYTLGKSNGMWTSKGTLKCRLLSWKRPVLNNGYLHWLAKGSQSFDQHIVSFNLEVEEFHEIPAVPQAPIWNITSDSELKELGGCLCLIHKGERLIDIWEWKWKEYSWVQGFSIKWLNGKRQGYLYYSPCAIKKKKNGDDLVLMWCEREELVDYDSKRRNLEYVVRGSRQVLNRSSLPPPLNGDPILHINSVISLKALGEDVKLCSVNHHRKRKAY